MKKAVAIILTVVAVFTAHEGFASKYSIGQVYEMIQLSNRGIIGTNFIFSDARAKGIKFEIRDLVKFKKAHSPANADLVDQFNKAALVDQFNKDLKMLAAVIEAVAQPAPPVTAGGIRISPPDEKNGVALRGDLSTNLVHVATNTTVLGTNLMALGSNMADVGASISLHGTNAPALGTNTPSFGTNMMEIGTNMSLFAANLAMPQGLYAFKVPLFFVTGAKFQNPYAIGVDPSKTSAMLNNSGNGTVGFLELAWLDRYGLVGPGQNEEFTGANGDQWRWPLSWTVHPDFEAHIGWVLANSLVSTNYSASTLAGGGDFYTDLAVAFPFWRSSNNTTRQQLTIELRLGASTDKNFEQVHSTFFSGVGYQLGYPADILSTAKNASGLLSFKLGYGLVDAPVSTVTASSVMVNMDGGLPQFDHKWVPAGSIELLYPFTDGIYFTASANIYSFREIYSPRGGPDQWDITVGVTIPFGKLNTLFKPMIGLAQ